MEKLYELNNKLAGLWKLGKLQFFVYPLVLFAFLAAAVIIVAIFKQVNPDQNAIDHTFSFISIYKSIII